MNVFIVNVVLLCGVAAVTAAAPEFTTVDRPDLDAIFTPESGWNWLGGDSSASVQLSRSKSLWIFGDTLKGRLVHNDTQRKIESMPHSSLAFLHHRTSAPRFVFPTSTRGIFFPPAPAPNSSYYWLIDGLIGQDTGKLIIQAMVINNTADGFVQLGSDLVVVENPNMPPKEWKHHSLRLPFTNGTFTSNEGIAQMDGYIYMMGNCNGTTACLSRVLEETITSGYNFTIEYFSGKDKGWSIDVNQSSMLFQSPFSEGTLKYNEHIGWYVFLCQAYDAYVTLAYTGPETSLEGPWILKHIYEIPERNRINGSFSYAAKSHPEMAASGKQLIFTYNTNVGPGRDALVNRTWAYHPFFVQVDLE